MSPMSEARKRANKTWNDANMKERYDRIQLVVPKGQRDVIKDRAAALGLSVNAYVLGLVEADLAGATRGIFRGSEAGGVTSPNSLEEEKDSLPVPQKKKSRKIKDFDKKLAEIVANMESFDKVNEYGIDDFEHDLVSAKDILVKNFGFTCSERREIADSGDGQQAIKRTIEALIKDLEPYRK